MGKLAEFFYQCSIYVQPEINKKWIRLSCIGTGRVDSVELGRPENSDDVNVKSGVQN